MAHADRPVARGASGALPEPQRPAATARGARRDVCAVPRRGDRAGRRGPEPDLGRALVQLREARALSQFGRHGHHGLCVPRLDGREARESGSHRLLRHRRRRLRHEHAGDGDDGGEQHRRQGPRAQQSLPGHGAPVPGRFLRGRSLRRRPDAHPRFRQARRCVRHEGHDDRPARGRWSHAGRGAIPRRSGAHELRHRP